MAIQGSSIDHNQFRSGAINERLSDGTVRSIASCGCEFTGRNYLDGIVALCTWHARQAREEREACRQLRAKLGI